MIRMTSLVAVCATTSLPILWFSGHGRWALVVLAAIVIASIIGIRNWKAQQRERAMHEQETIWLPPRSNQSDPHT